jgi:hypothetical protein
MNPYEAYQVVVSRPDLLMLREPPYAMAGWAAVFSGIFMAVFVVFMHWKFGSSRTSFVALLIGSGVCLLLGVWLVGLEYNFSFFRDKSAIEVSTTWFGLTISSERLTYTSPPVADIVTTKRTTHQLVLRFNDGRVKTLGLSTDQEGHQETADMINRFLQTGSVVQ